MPALAPPRPPKFRRQPATISHYDTPPLEPVDYDGSDASRIENLGAIGVIVDRHGTVLAWTREFGELASRPSHEVRGRPLWEFASPDNRNSLRGALIDIASDREPRHADAVMSSSGGQRRIAWTCSFMSRDNDDPDDSIVCWGMDVTAREQELSAIYEHVPGILFYVAVEPGGEFRFRSMRPGRASRLRANDSLALSSATSSRRLRAMSS